MTEAGHDGELQFGPLLAHPAARFLSAEL